ncbi:MAG: EFR1 family ferrodoxin, partial [Bacteroidaceae bacterium]
MDIQHITPIYFSATGSTKKITTFVSQHLKGVPNEAIDITCGPTERLFPETDLVVLGIPVYSGRVAPLIAEHLKGLQGQNTPAVILAVYGNRDYDDALLELKNVMRSQGFSVCAAIAAVAEHSIVHSVAKGRPHQEDFEILEGHCLAITKKIECNDHHWLDVIVEGKIPYRTYNRVPFHPHTTQRCKLCGVCATSCPAGAIPLDAPNKTIAETCISCMRCIAVCPSKARTLTFLERTLASISLHKKCKEEKFTELF